MSGKQEEQRMEKVNTEIAIIDEQTIRDRIYVVRGVKVMLDFDLAEIYGYNTMAFNQQVKNNIEKFDGDDFCFYLTQEEFRNLISKNMISSWGGRRKPPRAFTQSGVYMLMTVLRGELAIKQSRALIRIFRAMKDYMFHCGASSKDAAVKLTTAISELTSEDIIRQMHVLIDQMKGNPALVLK